MAHVIGIDLGTTYSAVAYQKNGQPEIIPDKTGRRTMPSVVSFANDTITVGEAARLLELSNPDLTVKRIKRKMGTDYKVQMGGREYTPEEISSFLLKKLKQQAEESLGETVKDAIITVPAYFNDNQRQATKNAGKLAGLNVLRIINEPTAASLAYGVSPEDDLNIVVYDLGGGTFDVSVLNVADGIFEVISTAGDNNLGGEDFNRRLMDSVIARFQEETGIDLSGDSLAQVKIYEAVEAAKIELSTKKNARIYVPFVSADENGPKNIDFEIDRAEFERIIMDYINRSVDLCQQALTDGNLSIDQIDRVILVGGSSRIPLVRETLKEFFKKELDSSINPDEVVARGAALQGGIVKGDVSGIVLVDVTPMSLGIEVENGYFVPIIERNTPIPTSARRIFTTVSDTQKCVDVQVMQGESMYSKNNVSLGKFRLEGIRGALKGEPRIEVTFELDVNGILNVSAMDADTQNIQGITIVNQNRISDEELSRIQKEHVIQFEDEIKKRAVLSAVLKLKTRAENIASKIDHSVPPAYKSKLVRGEIEEIMQTVESSVKELDPSKIEHSIERLEFMMNEIMAGTYQSGGDDRLKTYYDVLGIQKTADAKAVKSAYRKLVKQFHPDVIKTNRGSSKIFEEITIAYNTLSKPEKRKEYDASLASKKQASLALKFQFREFKNWLFSLKPFRIVFPGKKVAKGSPAVDPAILSLSIDELLQRLIYSKNVFVQTNAVKAIIAKDKRYAVNDLLRLLYSSINDAVKIEIIQGLKNFPEKRIREVVREIYDIEKSLSVKQAIRTVIKVA